MELVHDAFDARDNTPLWQCNMCQVTWQTNTSTGNIFKHVQDVHANKEAEWEDVLQVGVSVLFQV